MFHDYQESGPALLGDPTRKLHASFRLSPSNSTIANTLRRQILVGTPSVGFRTEPYDKSDVVIQANTTPLVNEMIAHRIGMIPIRADPTTFDPDRYEFRLEKENRTKEMMDIHASDFIVIEKDPSDPYGEGRAVPTSDFFPPDPITGSTCLITRLRPQWNPTAAHERLALKARASISTGSENSRWTPVSQCSFENTHDENPERQEAMFLEWLSINKKITDVTGQSADRIAELRREYNTMEIQRCYRVDEFGEPNDFTFYIESIGIQSIPQCVSAGIQSIIQMLTRYQDVDGELPTNVTLQHADARFPCVDIVFKEETHTLGNLLQHYLVDHHVDGKETPKITYAGYKVPHPLRKEMVLRIGLETSGDDPDTELQTARLVVAKVSRSLKEYFQAMLENWIRLNNQEPTS